MGKLKDSLIDNIVFVDDSQPQRQPLTEEEAIRYAQECSKSAYQRGYLDGIHRECPHCADYKAMYLRVRDELAALK